MDIKLLKTIDINLMDINNLKDIEINVDRILGNLRGELMEELKDALTEDNGCD